MVITTPIGVALVPPSSTELRLSCSSSIGNVLASAQVHQTQGLTTTEERSKTAV